MTHVPSSEKPYRGTGQMYRGAGEDMLNEQEVDRMGEAGEG